MQSDHSDDRTYREYDKYGRMLLNMYIQDNGNKLYTYYDETGIKTEEKTLCVNGDIVDNFFDSSGIVIKQVMDNSDGTKSITEYNDSHKRIRDIFYDSDGKIIQAWTMEYSEDGKEKLEVNLCADGSKFITTYDENGNQIQKTYTYADGRTIILDDSDDLDD